MVNKRAVLILLLGSTVLFLANVAMAHKSFEDEEAEAAKVEAPPTPEDADSEAASELDRNIAAQKAAASQPFDPIKFSQTYFMESCFMAFFVGCFVVLFLGKRHNAMLAELWHEKSLPLIREQFAYVGMEDGRHKVDIE